MRLLQDVAELGELLEVGLEADRVRAQLLDVVLGFLDVGLVRIIR